MRGSLQSIIRDLHRRRGRERRGLALAEGIRLVEEALAAGIGLQGAVISPTLEATKRGRALAAALEASGQPVERVDDAALAKLADTEQPQGVVAVVEPRQWLLADISLRPRSAVLVLDSVQDPGNVGTMMRTAFGLGAAGVVALPGTVEFTNPKVLRGSMGAAFRLPNVPATTEAFLEWAKAHGVGLWVADAAGAPVTRRKSTAPLALIVGNEGAGVGPALTAAAEQRISIPLVPGSESLNVGAAAAILLYEVLRDD